MNGFDFDFIAFLSAGKDNAAVVIFLVLVLTYLAGRFGAQGKVQLGISLGLGFVLGGTFQAAETGWPATYEGWFWLVIYALAAIRYHGPFGVYIAQAQYMQMLEYYTDGSGDTALKRVLELPQIDFVKPSDFLAAASMVVVASDASSVVTIIVRMPHHCQPIARPSRTTLSWRGDDP